jgi:hypothetical protein
VLTILDTEGEGDVPRRPSRRTCRHDVRAIDRYGDRLAQAITAFGAAIVLVLVMFEADHFWIGNALFLIGAMGATWGAIAKIRAYHGAFHGPI